MTTPPDIWIYALLLLATVCCAVIGSCPGACECKDCYEKDGTPALAGGCKMVCQSESPAASLTTVPQGIPLHVTQIDLSGNALTQITPESFAGLKLLQKLDLSSNQIKSVAPRSFKGLDSLTKLSLSGNGLKTINATLFEGMPKLQKLELASNELESVPEGTFDVLPSLQKVDFQSHRLVCDCRLKWVVKWQRTKSVRIRESTECSEPMEHRGKPLRELKRKQFICDESISLPYFALSPSTSQVVFEGDRLPLECRASVPDIPAHMMWLRGTQTVTGNASQGLTVRQTTAPDHSMLLQSLVIERLSVGHSGVWTCFIQTARGNASKSVNIVVMSLKETYCPAAVTVTSRGTFSWPKTLSGIKLSLPCDTGPAPWYTGDAPASASYECTVEGAWDDLDDSQCGYISEVTRILEEYSRELTNTTNLLSYMGSLVSGLADKMDVVYIARIMEKLSKQVKDNEQVADFLLSTASSLMNVNDDILRAAQTEDNSCSKVVKVMEGMPKELLWEAQSVSKHADNIAMAARQVRSADFAGVTCSVWRYTDLGRAGVQDVYQGDSLRCVDGGPGNDTGPPHPAMELESSIHIPGDIFRSVRCLFPICSDSESFHIQVVAYKSAKLFPVVRSRGSDTESYNQSPSRIRAARSVPRVVSSVMAANIVSFICLAGVSVDNTSTPIVTQLRVPTVTTATGSGRHGVYWDFNANHGRGSWLTRGCSIVEETKGLATVHCNHLTHFSVSEDEDVIQTPYYGETILSWLGRMFTMSPAVYGGSIVLVLCTMIVLITYIAGHRYILMPRKSKHAIANICLSLLLLCLTFTLGIHIRQPIMACRVVGVALHYLSLVQLFWIAILTFTMYKKFVKLLRPPPPPTDPLEDPPPPRSPVTCYLIGWGISVIICGISGAINWPLYAGHSQYCFLPLNAALLTLLAPAALVVTVTLVLFLCICCLLRGGRTPEPRGPEPEEDGEEEEGSGPGEELLGRGAGLAELTASRLDLERRPLSQLQGAGLLLLLYLVCWVSAALALAPPLFPHQAVAASAVYGLAALGLGVLLLVFHCVSRRDCREAWRQCCYRPPDGTKAAGPREDEAAPAPMTVTQLGHVAATRRSNGHVTASASSLTNSVATSVPGAGLYSATCLLPPRYGDTSASSQPAPDASLPLFYNPRQNGIAKKYWEKKHKRNLLSNHMQREAADSGHSSEGGRHGGIIYTGGRRLSNHGSDNSRYLGNNSDTNRYPGNSGEMNRYPGNSSDTNRYPGNSSDNNRFPGNSIDANRYLCNGSDINRYPGNGSDTNHSGVILEPPRLQHAEQLQNMYNSLSRRRQLQQPVTIDPVTGQPMLLVPGPADRLLPTTQGPPSPLPPVMEDIPGQSCPSSVATMATFSPTQYLMGLAPYTACRRDDPAQCPPPRPAPHEYMTRNGSVPRLRDFDGQSAVSQTDAGPGQGSGRPTPPTPDLGQPSGGTPVPHSKQNGHAGRLVSDGETASDTDPFVKEIKQRIPEGQPSEQTRVAPGHKQPPLTVHGRGCSSDRDVITGRPVSWQEGSGGDSSRSQTQSEPAGPRGGPQPGPPSASKSWECAPRGSTAAPYAYVNHKYADKVVQKLLRRGQGEAGVSSLLPRSVSAYDHAITTETDTLDDDSSDDGAGDSDIWVVPSRRGHGSGHKQNSQETSV